MADKISSLSLTYGQILSLTYGEPFSYHSNEKCINKMAMIIDKIINKIINKSNDSKYSR